MKCATAALVLGLLAWSPAAEAARNLVIPEKALEDAMIRPFRS